MIPARFDNDSPLNTALVAYRDDANALDVYSSSALDEFISCVESYPAYADNMLLAAFVNDADAIMRDRFNDSAAARATDALIALVRDAA